MAKEKEAEEKIKGPFKFDYAWWDKQRPALLPSTGLGKALKAYQKAKADLKKSPGHLPFFFAAREALNAADKSREAAVKKCGTTFKKTKAALENSEQSLKGEKDEVNECVRPIFATAVKESLETLTAVKKRLEGSTETYLDLADKLEKLPHRDKNHPDVKVADKIVNSESDSTVPRIRDAPGSPTDTLLLRRRMLESDFPEAYKDLAKLTEMREEVGPAFRAFNDAWNSLKEVYNNTKKK